MVLISTTDYEIPTDGQLIIDRKKDPGQPKAYIPEYLYKPPYGFPRKSDLRTIRKLAATPYVHLIVRTLAQQVGTTKWEIRVKEEFQEDGTDYSQDINEITKFFKNPNDNDDSWEDLLVGWATDILELDSGVGVKVFNKMGDMVQVVARDGATFLKNPSVYGMMSDRADIIPPLGFDTEYAKPSVTNPFVAGEEINVEREKFLRGFYDANLKQKAAYFQYGWTAGRMPIPFGRREIVWFSSNKRTDTIYGRSPVEVLGDTLFTLLYGNSFSLDMFINNNIPAGIVQIIGANNQDIEAFKHRFEDKFIQKDVFSNKKKQWWNAPTVNQEVKWTPFNLSSNEMQVLESQQWYLKIAASCFGLTPSELGFTEDSNKAVDINQGTVFKRKALQPLLRLIEQRINTQIMPEFRVEALEFKFDDYDHDEDKKKHDILDQEIRMGVKTPEMVAQELGINVEELKAGKEEERAQRMEEQGVFSDFGGDAEGNQPNGQKSLQGPLLKWKYIRRTGGPGNYTYWYRNPKTGKLVAGDKPKEESNSTDLEKLNSIEQDLKNDDKEINKIWERVEKKEITQDEAIKLLKPYRDAHAGRVKQIINMSIPVKNVKFGNGDTGVVREAQKGNGGHIEMMSPDDFLKLTNVKDDDDAAVFGNERSLIKIIKGVSSGNEFQPGFLDYSKGKITDHEGRHRALAAKVMGIKKIPVGIIGIDHGSFDVNKTKHQDINYKNTNNPLFNKEEELSKAVNNFLEEQYKELESLIKQLPKDQLSNLNKKSLITEIIDKAMKLFNPKGLVLSISKVIKESYIEGNDVIEKQFDRNVLPNNEILLALEKMTFDNIQGATDDFKNKLRGILQRGVLNDRGVKEISAELREQLDLTRNRADVIARTEVNAAFNEGSLQGAKSIGLPLDKIWDSQLDARTSPVCNSLDGTRVSIDKPFKYKGDSFMRPPAHPNCRSRIIYILKNEEDKQ